MTPADIIAQRLINQQIVATTIKKPQDLVHHMVAIQSQDYAMGKWAIGLRLPGATDAAIEKLFNEGKILRTHMMRPTWHFVAPADIRWMLELTAPRVNAFNASQYRKLELDTKIFNRCNNILAKQLEGGKCLTRTILKDALQKAKINTDDIRLTCIMMYAELAGIICSGPREGKQFTYALLEERVPPTKKSFTKEEAIAELTHRYFATRGPATMHDFAWWSGLTIKDVKEGIANLGKQFVRKTVDGKEYIFIPADAKDIDKTKATFLLPDYDEYGISYKDRSALFSKGIKPESASAYYHMIVIDGIIAGTWKRTIKNNAVIVEVSPFEPLSKPKQKLMDNAIERYRAFIGKNLED